MADKTPTPTPKATATPTPVKFTPQWRGVYTTTGDVAGLWDMYRPRYNMPAAHTPSPASTPGAGATPTPRAATATPAPAYSSYPGWPGYQFQQQQAPAQQPAAATQPVSYSIGYAGYNPSAYSIGPAPASSPVISWAGSSFGPEPPAQQKPAPRATNGAVLDADEAVFEDWQDAFDASQDASMFGDAGSVRSVPVRNDAGQVIGRAWQAIRGVLTQDEFGRTGVRYSTVGGKPLNEHGYEGGYDPYQKGPTGSGGTQDLGWWRQEGDYGGAVNSYARGGSSSRG